MKKLIFIFFSLIIMLSSCRQQEDTLVAPITISATISSTDETKVSATENDEDTALVLDWEATDCLEVSGETTEVFTLTEIDGKKARFTGQPVEGDVFDITIVDTDADPSFSFAHQYQKGIESTDHVGYSARLKGVPTYSYVSFSPQWAEENDVELLETGCLLLYFQLPVTATQVSEVTLTGSEPVFYVSNDDDALKASSLKLTLTDAQVGSENTVKAYFMTPMNESVIPAGTTLSLKVVTNNGTYVKTITPGAVTIQSGKRNVIKVNSKNWQPIRELQNYTFMSYNAGVCKKYLTELGHYSYPEIASAVLYAGADVVGFNELDKNNSRTGYADQPNLIAEEIGSDWTYYFASAANDYYGNAIIAPSSLTEVKKWPKLTIPKGDGYEIRSMAAIEYEDFVFCVTHLDYQSSLARISGANLINEWVEENYGDSDKPIILVGDMNCTADDVAISILQTKWTRISSDEYTFSTPSPSKCIDFIFIWKNSAEYKVNETKVLKSCPDIDISMASDHYPLYVDITFYKDYPENVVANTSNSASFDDMLNNTIYSE